MIVIADTGPIHYLFLIGCLEILPVPCGQVLIPQSVVSRELDAPATPSDLRKLLQSPPAWLLVHPDPNSVIPSLSTLGFGESLAISLAMELHADLLLYGDKPARKKAGALAIPVVGTLGIISEAAVHGLLDFDQTIDRLIKTTNFHHSPAPIEQVRRSHYGRSSSGDN